MGNLRTLVESDLEKTLEDSSTGFGLPVEIVYPDGSEQKFKKGSTTQLLTGQVMYETVKENPTTGEEKIIPAANVSLRISSLDKEIDPKSKAALRIPARPDPDAEKVTYLISTDSNPDIHASIGFITIFLQLAKQAVAP